MKYRIQNLFILALMLGFTSCGYNQSIKKDLQTNAVAIGNGLAAEAIGLQINGKAENRNTFTYGENVVVVFNELSGFTEIDEKRYPGMAMRIIKNERDTVFYQQDLLEDLSEGISHFPLQLKANFTASLAYTQAENYELLFNIWDREGEGTLTYQLPFTVVGNEFIKVSGDGIEYSSLYLWDETDKKILFNSEVNRNHQLLLILNGPSGFNRTNDKVYPGLSLELVNNQGTVMLSDENLLRAYEETGIDAGGLADGRIPITLSFTEGMIYNPCTLKAVLHDRNSDKYLEIVTQLEVH